MKPNVSQLSLTYLVDVVYMAAEFRKMRDYAQVGKLLIELPLFPDVANAMKKKYGMQYLIERQFNLSRAVEEFGEDWLKEECADEKNTIEKNQKTEFQESEKKPFIKHFTIDEAGDLVVQAMELEGQGRYEEAEKLSMQVPLLPGIADNFKRDYGMQYLIDKQFNLSRAVEEFGEDWLKE